MEEALTQASDHSYFVMALTDEGRFLTPAWDEILRSYVGLFDDHAFRLRLSKLTSLVQYANYLTCSTMPESFPIFTRRWLELTEGFTNFSYGFDAYQQAIATRLAVDDSIHRDIWNSGGMFRDVPINTIGLGGIEFNKDVSEIEACTRMVIGTREWLRLVSYQEQEHISYLATKLRLYIQAKASGHSHFRLRRNARWKEVRVEREGGTVVASRSYRIPRLRAHLFYIRVLFGLLPARMRYAGRELILRQRIRGSGKKHQVGRQTVLRAFARRPGWSAATAGERIARGLQVLQRHWLVGRVLRPLLSFTRQFFPPRGGATQTPSLRPGRVRSAIRPFVRPLLALLRRLRRFVRSQRAWVPIRFVWDLLFYPADRLLWSPPALLDRALPASPFGTYLRLRKLSYPVADREVMLTQQDKIEELKRVKYGDILY
jgi:hypothetical protein